MDSWYEIEFSFKGGDNWFVTGDNFDTLETAAIKAAPYLDKGYDVRITKVTVTREVVETL
jgi:hypothetical protein